MNCKGLLLVVLFTRSCSFCPALFGQEAASGEPLLQLCSEYSRSGDLLEAAVSSHLLNISIARPTGQVVKFTDRLPDSASRRCTLGLSLHANSHFQLHQIARRLPYQPQVAFSSSCSTSPPGSSRTQSAYRRDSLFSEFKTPCIGSALSTTRN